MSQMPLSGKLNRGKITARCIISSAQISFPFPHPSRKHHEALLSLFCAGSYFRAVISQPFHVQREVFVWFLHFSFFICEELRRKENRKSSHKIVRKKKNENGRWKTFSLSSRLWDEKWMCRCVWVCEFRNNSTSSHKRCCHEKWKIMGKVFSHKMKSISSWNVCVRN